MAYKNLDEFHFNHDHQYNLNAVTTQDLSCPKCHPLKWQLAKFKQFLGWYRNRQAVKTFSQRLVKIFDQYLADLNKQWAEDSSLTKDQVKILEERAWFIIKSFRYISRPSIRSAELRFYITKLAEVTGFDPRCLHEITYQGQILKWEEEYAESQNKGYSYILNSFKYISWDLRSSRKDKGKEEVNSLSGDDFEEQLL